MKICFMLLLMVCHQEYDSFSSAIRTRSDVLSIEELNTLLNAKERAIKKRTGTIDATSMALVANY